MMETALIFLADPWHVFISSIALINAGAGLPQGVHIWKNRSAKDVNFTSWAIWWSTLLILTIYVWANVTDPIIRLSYLFGCLVNTFVLVGIIRARRQESNFLLRKVAPR